MKSKISILLFALLGLWACSENDKENEINDDMKMDEQGEVVGQFDKKFVQNILIEEYTATWCGNCPKLLYPLAELTKNNSKVIALAIHTNDQMSFTHYNSLKSEFGIGGTPSGRLNRITQWNGTENELSTALAKDPKLGLSIESSIEGDDLNVSVKVGFNEMANPSLKLVVMVSEDGLVYDQANYFNNEQGPWYQQGNPIKSFEHNHVLRTNLTDIFGSAIPADNLKEGNQYTLKLSKAVNSLNLSNQANAHIVAFVVNANKEVINVQEVKLGENKDYEFIE